jgi:hypothetical protein
MKPEYEEDCTGDDSVCEEDDCSGCPCYLACFGEYPWTAAQQEYERSRGC